ncbi:MAG: GxxExxY protein [Cyanobacteria bacterium J06638_22]
MDADARRAWLNSLTEQVIGCAFQVGGTLGNGFLERVYENALAHELQKAGLVVEQQKALQVQYDGVAVGDFFVDLLVERELILELKALPDLTNKHFAQCMNYLKAANLTLALLLNFGTLRVEVKRIARNF